MLLHDYLHNSAMGAPDKTACVAGDDRVSYRDLDEASNRLAHLLQRQGLQPGDRVAIFLDNSIEAAISTFAVLKAGGAFVFVNPTTKTDKTAYILQDSGARCAFMDGRKRDVVLAACSVPSLKTLVLRGGDPFAAPDGGSQILAWDQSVSEMPPDVPASICIDMDLAAIVYTSGSTGKPKGVVLTHRNMTAAAESVSAYLENVPDDIILNVLPLSFDYGLYQLLMSVKIGGTLILEKSFAYPYQIVRRIREESVTGFPGVPTMFAMLLQIQGLDPAEFDSVRYISNTGAALPPAHIARLKALFRNAKIFSMYGVTECKRVSYMPPEQLDRRPGSVGIPIPNEQVWIVDEHGNPLPPNRVGELVVRGANVMQGYWNQPDATNDVLRPSGKYPWEKVLYTGDLFRMDDDGYLYFVSRKDDIIKSRGEKVSPKEVENVLYELEGIHQAAVVGVPDNILGQAIKACVVAAAGTELSEREIIAHCARRLENFMVPKYVEILSELPRTSTGKIHSRSLTKTCDEGHVCARCVLSAHYPGVRLDGDGVCNICLRRVPDSAVRKEELRRRFREFADSVRPNSGYHAVLAFSGGKDSTYTLWLLCEQYNLRVLALTFDNGFISPAALSNIRIVTETAGADSVVVKPRFDLLKEVFAKVVEETPFPQKALERASAICNACITFVKDAVLTAAIRESAPMVVFGWSPGQAPLASSMFRMNASMLHSMHEARALPLLRLAGDRLRPYLFDDSGVGACNSLPYNVNPLAFHDYSEHEMMNRLNAMGWAQPSGTDGNSTNCLLNNLATRLHLGRYGFHPYGFEVAELVRTGAVSREYGLASLANLGDTATARWAADRLGLDFDKLELP